MVGVGLVVFANHPHRSHLVGSSATEVRSGGFRFGPCFEHRLFGLIGFVVRSDVGAGHDK